MARAGGSRRPRQRPGGDQFPVVASQFEQIEFAATVRLSANCETESDAQRCILLIDLTRHGLLFMQHGMGKLFGFPPFPNQPAPFHLLWFAGIIETFGGFLVALGLFTHAAAFIMSGEMAIGYFMWHAPRSFFPMLNRSDAAILYCFIFFYFFVAGAAAWSLDRLRVSEAGRRYASG